MMQEGRPFPSIQAHQPKQSPCFPKWIQPGPRNFKRDQPEPSISDQAPVCTNPG